MCGLFILAYAPRAAAQSGVQMDVQAGLDGVCKYGQWLPVQVTLENHLADVDGRLEISIDNGSGARQRIFQEISLPNPSRKVITLNLFPDSFNGDLLVRFLSGNRELARQKITLACLSPTDRIYGLMTASPGAFAVLADLDPPNGSAQTARLRPEDLPAPAAALESLNALILAGADTSSLSQEQRAALSGWVRAGGVLIVGGGANVLQSTAGLDPALLALQPQGTQEIAGLDGLSAFASPAPEAGNTLIATGDLNPAAEVLAATQEDLPLAACMPVGYGRSCSLAFDPTAAAVRDWDGLAAMFARLLSNPAPLPTWASGFQDWSMASQAASTIPGLGLPSPGLMLCFLGVYVLVVGPLNLIFLLRLKRRELAWLTIPALVLLFSGLAFGVGKLSRGSQPVLSRLAVVQTFAGSPQARLDGLVGLFSVERAVYDLQVGPGLLAHAIESQPGAQTINDHTLQYSDAGVAVPDLRLDVSEFSALAVEGEIRADPPASNLALRLNAQDATIAGSLTNGETALEDAALIAFGQVKRLGSLGAGETRDLQFLIQPGYEAIPAQEDVEYPPGMAVSVGASYAYPSGPTDLITAFLGTSDYYAKPESYRRFALLSAAAPPYRYGLQSGMGVFLMGWSETTAFHTALPERDFRPNDLSLYIHSLPIKVESKDEVMRLDPGFFTWSTTSAKGEMDSPYRSDLSGAPLIASFRLALDIPYQEVSALTLHLAGYGSTGQVNFEVFLYDFESSEWTEIPAVAWGDTEIPEPARFVGPGAEIRLQLDDNAPNQYVSLEKADFTLEVIPLPAQPQEGAP